MGLHGVVIVAPRLDDPARVGQRQKLGLVQALIPESAVTPNRNGPVFGGQIKAAFSAGRRTWHSRPGVKGLTLRPNYVLA